MREKCGGVKSESKERSWRCMLHPIVNCSKPTCPRNEDQRKLCLKLSTGYADACLCIAYTTVRSAYCRHAILRSLAFKMSYVQSSSPCTQHLTVPNPNSSKGLSKSEVRVAYRMLHPIANCPKPTFPRNQDQHKFLPKGYRYVEAHLFIAYTPEQTTRHTGNTVPNLLS